jgi:acyl dehydratase
MPIPGYTLDTIDQFVGRELGVSDWVTIGQHRINQSADATNDHQWINVDAERAARESLAKTTSAYGFLTLSALAGMTMEIAWCPAAGPRRSITASTGPGSSPRRAAANASAPTQN